MPAQIAQLLFCPEAGGFSRSRLSMLLKRLKSAGYEVCATPCGPGMAASIIKEATHLAVMGGDGTVRNVIDTALTQSNTRHFLVYPGGTVNLLARNLQDIALADQNEHACFIADVSGQSMVNCMSIGPDSLAVAWNPLWLKHLIGRISYAMTLLAVLIFWRRASLNIKWDDGSLQCEAVYIAKSRYYAGQWSFAPEACISSPVLQVVALKRCRRRDYLQFMMCVLTNRWSHATNNIVRFQSGELIVESAANTAVQIDGDIADAGTLRIAVNPNPVTIGMI